jgi:hypothetical protein
VVEFVPETVILGSIVADYWMHKIWDTAIRERTQFGMSRESITGIDSATTEIYGWGRKGCISRTCKDSRTGTMKVLCRHNSRSSDWIAESGARRVQTSAE